MSFVGRLSSFRVSLIGGFTVWRTWQWPHIGRSSSSAWGLALLGMKLGFAKTPLIFRITSILETPPSATPSFPLPCEVASSAGFLAGGLDKASLILFRPIRCESSFSTACNAEDYICTIKRKDEWEGGGEERGGLI